MKRLLFVLLTLFLLVTPNLPIIAIASSNTIVFRDQYSNTYDMRDGTYKTTMHLISVNYETVANGFQPIQTDVLPSAKAFWDWEVETGHWQLYIKNDTTVQVKKDNYWVGQRLHGIAYLDVATKEYEMIQTVSVQIPIVAGNTITWENLLYGTDFVIRYTNDSFKEDIVIKQSLRNLLSSPGHRPIDYGLNTATTYLVPVFEVDWSRSLPMQLKNGISVDPNEAELEEAIYFRSTVKDRYFDTLLVSFMPLDYAVSENPINPLDPEAEWVYASEKIRKRLITRNDKHWLLMGVPVLALNQMPEGSIVFDPTETLRPNAAGYLTECSQEPGSGANWDKVDEAVADGSTTFVYCRDDYYAMKRDLYVLPNPSLVGIINSVTVYAVAGLEFIGYGVYGACATYIRTHSTNYAGNNNGLSGCLSTYYCDWDTQYTTYDTNPFTSVAWTWTEIDDLQAGVRLIAGDDDGEDTGEAGCTQVYVEVNYTLPTAPTVTTQDATVTSNVTATGNGNITSTGGINCDMRGVVYDTVTRGEPGNVAPGASGYSDNITEHGDFGTGTFTASITGLAQGTPYFYRAFAHNSEGYSYGNEVNFVTMDVPTITTDAATNVAYTTARVNSTLDDDGRLTCEVRFQYYEDGNPVWGVNTTWVGGYTTGQQPYADLTGLTSNKLHHFRAQARNAYGTVNGTSLDFTTASDIFAPANLKAFPEGERVVLSWTIGGGSTETAIRYKEGSYPTTTSDGTQGYFGALSNAAIEDLESGTTIYISAWGHSGDTYSDNYTTVMATTTASPEEGDVPGVPATPPTWFQTPDYTVLAAIPFYAIINAFFDAYEMPRASGWFFSTILSCIVFAILVFVLARHPVPAMIALAVALALSSLIKLLPMFMMAFAVIFMFGAFQLGRAK